MVQAGELLRITEAKFNLEPCAVIPDDVSSWHVKVCREVDLVTTRLRIVYHNLDVPFHGNRIRLYHESLPAFHVKRLTVGKVGSKSIFSPFPLGRPRFPVRTPL